MLWQEADVKLFPERKVNMTKVKNEGASTESAASLHLLSSSDLELTQNITLSQMSEETEHFSAFLLSRVWYRLEQERRRRRNEVRELERMYFTRGETPAEQKRAPIDGWVILRTRVWSRSH